MIDDVLGMAKCGDDSLELNTVINAKMETKRLRLSNDKWYTIHICKIPTECDQILKVMQI